MSGEFYCEACKGTFEKARSDEEAMSEFLAGPFFIHGDSVAVICEDCYKELENGIKSS